MKAFFGFCLTLILLLTSCSNSESRKRVTQWEQWKTPNGKLKVLSTTAMIDDLVKQVGGDHIDALVLISGELDPHSYQMVKGDDEKLLMANVIFYNGLGLEHHPSIRNHLESNQKSLGLGDCLHKENPRLILYHEGQLDPHIWMDISLWTRTIPYIVDELSRRDPQHAKEYVLCGKNLEAQMMQQHEHIRNIMAGVPENKRFLVTSHDAFHYFTLAYMATDEERNSNSWGKRFAAPEGLSPESQLSAIDIQHIIDHLSQYQIQVVFAESNVSQDSLRKIVYAGQEKGLRIDIANTPLYADALGKPGSDGDTYLKMIQYNASTIQRILSQEAIP